MYLLLTCRVALRHCSLYLRQLKTTMTSLSSDHWTEVCERVLLYKPILVGQWCIDVGTAALSSNLL